MKKINLKVKINRVLKNKIAPAMPMITPTMSLNTMLKKDLLVTEVVNALINYTGGSIEDAQDTIALAERLNLQPIRTVSDEEFALIESAIATTTAEVKAAWSKMVKQNNE